MVIRRGAGSIGCMGMLVIAGVAIWIGLPAARVYFRAYEYEDVLRQGLQFAAVEADSTILRKVRAAADSIEGLPAEARDIRVERRSNAITITGGYEDVIRFPFRPKTVRFDHTIERKP
jgi:hypothetical protein